MVAVAFGSVRPFVSLACVACACGSNNYVMFLFETEERSFFLFVSHADKNEILATPDVRINLPVLAASKPRRTICLKPICFEAGSVSRVANPGQPARPA